MTSKLPLLCNSDDKQRSCDEVCLLIDHDTSIEETIHRVLVVGHKFIMSDLKILAYSFGLRWNICTTRSSRVIKCNRTRRRGY